MLMLPPNKKGKLDVAGALDLGVLSVIKDMGLKKNRMWGRPFYRQVRLRKI